MKDEKVAKVILDLAQEIRSRWDRLGYLETDDGAFATGHVPNVAPHAYLCRFYPGLSDAGLDDAEAESERYLPQPYRDILSSFNGARIMGISLHGATGGQTVRDAEGIGQPISIRYQNVFYTRPEFIPEGHFGLGAMNGPRYSQGHLYLTSVGEVELINRDHDLVAMKWPSLTEFLNQEIARQLSRYDDEGRETGEVPRLPGNTDNWEALGKETSDRRKKEDSVLHKTFTKLSVFRKK
ncbi:SMI1/KNR4 family protein [uncultured Tateyamaria sp.]|uniref:SMI1/KNR4 family protein n=1 Tax=uncultured Tateyamaria sp. TaxID=455651 RepID=UPI00260C957E|nr:SMI1/KNR4 family protein [uncultured Tateyamaria sp.]